MVSDKVFTTDGTQKIFSSDFDVISEDHLRVFLDGTVVSRDDYDLINNAAVFHVAPAASQTLTLQVGTTPADILTSPTDAGIVAANIADIQSLADIAGDISTVENISSDVETVADLSTNVTTVATNISSVNTVASNINEVITVANDLTEAISEVETVALDLQEATSEIEVVANDIANVNNVGTNITDVNTVATNIANVNTTATNIADVNIVADDIANVNTTASDIANVNTVATDIANVNTTATNIADVNTVADNIADVNTVEDSITNVNTVATDIANVNTTATNIADVNTLVANIADINTVEDSIANVDAVGTDIANVNIVATDIANVNAVANNETNVNTVATDIANVNTVATNINDINTVADDLNEVISEIETVANDLNESLSEIETVAASITNVDAVGTNISNVNTVATDIANVNTTATDITNVNTVAASITNVDAVGTNISNVNTVATNISDVNDAYTNATNAAASAAAAATSETNAATSATAASQSATSAATSASNALTSQNAAQTYASNALTSANNASTSATNAATSETNAAASESNASASATAAAASAANAALAYDQFDDRYLGSKSADPAVDNDGNALVVGALYFNTTDGVMKVYTSSGWVSASSSLAVTFNRFMFTATSGQTAFTGSDDNGETLTLAPDYVMVTLNGIQLEYGSSADFTATSSTITLTSGATAGDELNVYAFSPFEVADVYTRTQADAYFVSTTGNVSLTNKTIDDISNDIGADHVHLKVRNETGSTINAGVTLKVTGWAVGHNCITVAPCSTTGDVAIGMTYAALPTNTNAAVTNTGVIADINTSSYSVGDILYTTGNGTLTTTKPTNGDYQTIGYVLRSHSSEGVIFVEFTEPNGISLPDQTGHNGQFLQTDGTTADWATVNSDLVSDTSPQLGGNLDTNGNDITFGDNDKAIFGAGSDLQIYHDGSTSYIDDAGTGDLNIRSSNDLWLSSIDNEKLARFAHNGAVTLYYDNASKLATTSTGIDVTGTVTADGLDMEDNHYIKLGTSDDLQIFHDGSNSYIIDNGTGNLIVRGVNLDFQSTSGEDYINCTNNGGVTLRYDNSGKLNTTSTGINVGGTITADGLDMDDNHRIKLGTSDDLQIYHDGSNSRIVDSGTGNLIVQADEMTIVNAANNETKADFISNGRVGLYYNNSQKLATTNTGVSVTGTVSATSFSGDGSNLTGLAAGAQDGIFWENDQAVTSNYTITTNKNAGTFGPITINSGVTVTVPSGSVWTIV